MASAPSKHATLVIVGPELWSTYPVFNSNAFPEELATIVHSCSLRAGMLLTQSLTLKHEIEFERQVLYKELLADRGGLSDAVRRNHQVPIIAFADGVRYTNVFYASLTTIKSFLDVYGLLMGKLIGRHLNWSFKRGRIGSRDISGGAIVNWLRRSAPKTLTASSILAEIIERHSIDWITDVVECRDTVAHYSEIKGLQHLRVPLRTETPYFRIEEFESPAMPNGQLLPEYVDQAIRNIRAFVLDTITKLPSITLEHISTERFLVPREGA